MILIKLISMMKIQSIFAIKNVTCLQYGYLF